MSQLGLADLVFPSAGFSRFSHSLGVCHLVGLMLEALSLKHGPDFISPEERQLYRLAGLLHDLGHYPYSHILEHAVREAYTRRFVLKKTHAKSSTTNADPFLTHEELSHEIAKNDPEMKRILMKHGIKAHDIWSIIWGADQYCKNGDVQNNDIDVQLFMDPTNSNNSGNRWVSEVTKLNSNFDVAPRPLHGLLGDQDRVEVVPRVGATPTPAR